MIKEFLKLGRIEFAGFLICTMLSGALCIKGENLMVSEALPVAIIAILSNMWGFAHNDFHDAKLDSLSTELSSRPLVKGTITPGNGIIFIGILISATLLTTLLFSFDKTNALLVLFTSIILAGAYNAFSKQIPGMDFLFGASTGLLCFLGGMLVSVPSTPYIPSSKLLLVISSIYFLEYTIFNIGSTLKDVKNDMSANAKNIAIMLGVTVEDDNEFTISIRFTAMLLVLKTASLLLILITATKICNNYIQLLLLLAGIFSLYLTFNATRIHEYDRQEIGRRWIKQDAVSKLLSPLLLFPIIGISWFLFLTIFPFVWFLLSTIVLHGKGNELPRGF